jgi:hypothetical protein
MTADDYRRELLNMVQKPPRAEKITSVQAVREFKNIALKAQRTSGKSLAHLQSLYNTLKGYCS